MTEDQRNPPQSSNQTLIIGSIVVVVLLIIGVVALIFWMGGSGQNGAVAGTATGVAMGATATITLEVKETEDAEIPTVTVTEEPTQEATEEPTKEPTTEAPTEDPTDVLPAEPQDIHFQAEDGQALQGRYYPGAAPNAPLIILMHWAPGNMDDWNEIAFWLQNRGLGGTSSNIGSAPWLDPTWYPILPEGKSYAVFTFNFRSGERGKMLLDAQTAFNTARALEGINPSQIASLGASIGADGALDGCLWHNENIGVGCLGALSLSPGSYLTVPYNEAVDKLGAEEPPKPVWCFFGTDDTDSANACQSASGDHYRMVEWSGGRWHGMELIDPTLGPNALLLILDWLALMGL